jgi:carbamoyltransferase
MGLAPYGSPVYKDAILQRIVDLKLDGSFRLDMSYFNYCQGLTMTSAKLHRLFGGPPRSPESEITQRHMDLAASVQAAVEEIMLRMARHIHAETGMSNLALAGGVALNCVANGRLLQEGPFENLWIQPAAGDAGGALGTALFIWHQLLQQPRDPQGKDSQQGSFLGPRFSEEEIRQVLDEAGACYTLCSSDDELCSEVAALVAEEKVVGWFQDRMEFGPRALGARSILGDARSPRMQSVMNRKIKFRESFRPFAPIVLREHVHRYFEVRPNEDSPYMMLVAAVRPELRMAPGADDEHVKGFEKLHHRRSEIPAVTHVDGSARIQTVDHDRHPLLHRLLTTFHARTGCPVMINTSFNVRGEPIVCTPQDAYHCFQMTDMDALALGRCLLLKDRQHRATAGARERHLAQFQLD